LLQHVLRKTIGDIAGTPQSHCRLQRGVRMNRICRTIAAALLVFCCAAAAQSWPTKPIRAFIPFSAGSATDIVPRALFDGLSKELGQQIVVENRGGAGGTLGIGEVVRAAPDGYTILANSSAQTIARGSCRTSSSM
jgi:tripartite-type tricarboxylate transporter receptor subunit TctC